VRGVVSAYGARFRTNRPRRRHPGRSPSPTAGRRPVRRNGGKRASPCRSAALQVRHSPPGRKGPDPPLRTHPAIANPLPSPRPVPLTHAAAHLRECWSFDGSFRCGRPASSSGTRASSGPARICAPCLPESRRTRWLERKTDPRRYQRA
jgi:hypothetical protein